MALFRHRYNCVMIRSLWNNEIVIIDLSPKKKNCHSQDRDSFATRGQKGKYEQNWENIDKMNKKNEKKKYIESRKDDARA